MANVIQRLRQLNRKRQSQLSLREVEDTVNRAVSQGLVSRDSGHMVLRILDLSETTLSEVMIPKAQISGVPASASVSEIVAVALRSGHSRLPVYEDSLDNIIGIIHVKELLRLWNRPRKNLRAVEFIRLPNFFPQTMKVAQALSEFKKKRISVGLVIDEYGAPVGMVTAGDLIEEIVGEMEDELDREFRYHRLLEDSSYLVEASMPLEKFQEAFSLSVESRAHTVGGLVLETLQRIPAAGERFQLLGFGWEVLEATPSKLSKIKLNLPGR